MYQLTLIRGAELAEGVMPQARLPEPLVRFAIGRDPANPWPIPDRTRAISACHCEIVATPAGPALRDLSTNGTFVNAAPGRLVGEHLLDDGDVFELGPYAIRVSGPRRALAAAPIATPVAAPVTAHTTQPRRTPGVLDTAPLRGGDPAAMLAAAASAEAAPWGLTEILRHAPPTAETDVDVTQIRVAPKASSPGTAQVRAATPAAVPSATPQANLAAAGPAADTLAAHQPRLLAAFQGAVQRLAADISPQALQASLGPASTEAQKARLWDHYTRIWPTVGTASGGTWEQGLVDAALAHLAALDGKTGPR